MHDDKWPENRPKVVSRLHAKFALDAKRLVISPNKTTTLHEIEYTAARPVGEGWWAHMCIRNEVGMPRRKFCLTEEELLDLFDNPDWDLFVYDIPRL